VIFFFFAKSPEPQEVLFKIRCRRRRRNEIQSNHDYDAPARGVRATSVATVAVFE